MSEIAPGFLVAVPQLGDPNFHRAVVLMIEHGEAGAMGIVINRVHDELTLAEVAEGQECALAPGLAPMPVFLGGPVEPQRGFVLHTHRDIPEAVALFDEVQVSGSIETLKAMLENPDSRFRLYLGYAGWGPGQLESELREGAWITAPATARHILETPPAQTWELVLRDMGIDPAMLQQGGGMQ